MQLEQGTQTDERAITHRTPGESVLIRFIKSGESRPHFVVPMRVVRDDVEGTMLYGAAGSTIRKTVHADGTDIPRDLAYRDRVRLDKIVGGGVWAPFHTLSIVPVGASYDIRVMWHQDDWSFAGWYVNLQAPLQQVPTGFDSRDWLLDLTVDPEGNWAWKDEDELADAVAVGMATDAFAIAVREVGASVIPMIESRSWPFDGSLVDWRPDPAWGPLPVPDGWDVVGEEWSHE